MKITVITASFNAERTIEQTISSVLSQDYKNLEYIIIDGKSNDGTVEIIKKYADADKRLVWISEPDTGLYNALNKGVRLASGDYIEILGADDALADSKVISRVVKEIENTTDIFSGQEIGVDEYTHRQHIVNDNHMARNKKVYDSGMGGMIGHAGMFVKRDILLKYPFDESYRIVADYKFFLQCYYDETIRFQYSDVIVAFFSLSGISSSNIDCIKENSRVYRELNLGFDAYCIDTNKSIIKRNIKKILCKLKFFSIFLTIYAPIKKYIKKHFLWEKHHCSNPICRWCER